MRPRKVFWLLRVATAATIGIVVRFVRRLARRPPRIIHGTYPMHMVPHMVRIDRLAGFPSRSIVNHSKLAPYALVTSSMYDTVLSEAGYEWDELHWAFLERLLLTGDIWVSFFDSVLSPDVAKHDRLLRMVKFCGIRLVMMPNGLDVIYLDHRVSRYDWVGRVQMDYPDWDLRAECDVRPERNASFCRHADLVIAQDNATRRFIPRFDVSFKYDTIDVHAIEPAFEPGNPVPVIVHAPNHRYFKGTEFLLRATDRLRERGERFELDIVERIPHDDAMERFRRADIVAEQFCMGTHANFALEGLSLGKPVLTYLDEEHLGEPAFNLPVVNTTPENLERVLAILLALPRLRIRLGRAGRDHAERFQSYGAMAAIWRKIYDHVWRGRPLDLHETALFDPSRPARSFTEDPARAEFWPVPVDDLLGEIRTILADPALVDPGIRDLVRVGRFRGEGDRKS